MALPGASMWGWTLLASLFLLAVGQETERLFYMVTIPAVIPAGSEAQLCASLLKPSEALVMTISLLSNGQERVLHQETSDQEFHRCFRFQAPEVQEEEVQNFQVDVRGERFSSTELRKVMIRPYNPMTFIQTDKPIYIPGQTVHFRVVTMDTSFRPVNQRYDVIELKDVNDNRIGQWINTTSNGKILQLSHPLNPEAPKGSYSLVAFIGENRIYHSFKVEKYVLPKFDVKLKMAETISIVQELLKVEVCATYTYGQPVPGTVNLKLCRPLKQHMYEPEHHMGTQDFTGHCHKEAMQLDKTGCVSHVFNMSTFTKMNKEALRDALVLRAEVEEEGTGVTGQQTQETELSYVMGTHKFIDTPKVFEKGSIVQGKVKVVRLDDTPIADQLVYLFEGEQWSPRHLQNMTTDKDGIATFTLNTTDLLKENIKLIATATGEVEYYGYRTPYFNKGVHSMSMIQPTSAHTTPISFLSIQKKDEPLPCGGAEMITVKYTLAGETVSSGSVDLIYLALSRGVIMQQGHKKVQIGASPVSEGEVTFQLDVSPEMAPLVQVLVYGVLPSTNVIAHSMDFPTQKCFKHKVSVAFSPSRALPGEESSLEVRAEPGSLCGLSAVDQSVLIMEPGKRLEVDKIFEMLPVTKASSPPYELTDHQGCLNMRPRRYVLPFPDRAEDSAYAVFQSLGLKVATNLLLREPSCLTYKGKNYYQHSYVGRYGNHGPIAMAIDVVGVGSAPNFNYGSAPAPVLTVRSFFPETWIWDLVEVGPSGSADVALTVPDTITTWETEAFCLSPQGLGLAPPQQLNVFQPFFLELSLPYSIIRGELFELKATVFNYLPSCIMVSVSPAHSLDYTLTPLSGVQYSSCLCANERSTFSWTMDAIVLGSLNITVTAEAVHSHVSCDNSIVSVPERGRIDVVTRSLLVKAEGTEKTDAYSWLLCPSGNGGVTEEVHIQLPKVVVDGSARASVSVVGDIMGRALQNLEGMLQMPYGCGEQNMALLAPNIYILEYLSNTQQLTPAIQDKAKNFLTSGYQRQLNYKHRDGAFSTFGEGEGNTWLTAFVMRSFGKAKSFVFIDPDIIEESKMWLTYLQKPNGCFIKLGKLFNNRMKGGVSDEVTLTAYITASMLELNKSVSDPIVDSSLNCLRNSSSDMSNTYTTALLAYTFALAGDMETRATLLNHLDKIASTRGGLHWSQSSSSSASLSVEISSYVLLATLSSSSVSAADLGYASRIVRWLVRQQNSYGGFSSTQDTVVALQALALFSTLVFNPEGSSSVSVQPPSGKPQLFEVNQGNKLLYQERALQALSGKYSLQVKGTACASVQLAVHYNIPTPAKRSTLSTQVTLEGNCSSSHPSPKHTLKILSTYSGKEATTNMVIVDLKMLSGFVSDPDSLNNLKGSLLVDRVETQKDHVIMYLRELPSGIPINHSLDIVQVFAVQKLKPAVVKIYDYYQPSDQAEVEYVSPCATDEGAMDV